MEYQEGIEKGGHDHDGPKIMEYWDTEKVGHNHIGQEIIEY